eukprot:TRINITY_DN9678_c2_g1_i1.p1 TRINITY_DN9678_c2_g1~~TRINITY_DN9678_c2_g1_i1.p1  ORF type:complete len:653 (+),score=73.17 TRINITY_DN9678_c2_g1_i1:382-2340(+)
MKQLSIETEDCFSSLLELAANNDLEAFKLSIQRDVSAIDEPGLWYGRQKGSKQMVLEHRTPLMVAATYGSVEVLQLLLSLSASDVNRSCGPDKSTALHCAASGGSSNAVEIVNLLLLAGADPTSLDANGQRPGDVIAVSPKLPNVRAALEELLWCDTGAPNQNLRVSVNLTSANLTSPPRSPSPENGSPSSSASEKASDKKEYPIDPTLPDIKNSIYSTDEFRMFSFKVRPCSRAYSHDWTECPFVHPGENARRRDPRKFHYSCVPCPDFRKGACRRGDMCEYAHGVFECWLHPAQYRTRLCKDGIGCARRVCFFAHTSDELRPLYVSTGSAVPSPRASMDMAAAIGLFPGSPSSGPSSFTPPMSPSNGISHSSLGWPQPNIPALHLPGSSLQSSRLRSSFNARDIPDEYSMPSDFDHLHLVNDFSGYSPRTRIGSPAGNRPGWSKTLIAPSNLDDLFSSEISISSSPYSDRTVLNQFPQQQQNCHSMLQASLGVVSSPSQHSPRAVDPISPMGSRLSMFAQREKHQQQLRSLSSRDLGSGSISGMIGSPVNPWPSKWGGSAAGKMDWGGHSEEVPRIRRSSSFELGSSGEEPDLSWVQSLVKESPQEIKEKSENPVVSSGEGSNSNSQVEAIDHTVIGAWIEQMQLDQLVA